MASSSHRAVCFHQPKSLRIMLSRRSLLTGSLALIFTPATGVLAQQAEWQQNFEGASRSRVTRSAIPILSPQTLAASEQVPGE